MEKETLEEAAERIAKEHCNIRVNPNTTEFQIQQFIIKGAYWQAKRMYSEEEVIEILTQRCKEFGAKNNNLQKLLLKQDLEWFEQFKKK
jgi:hypothetical protein